VLKKTELNKILQELYDEYLFECILILKAVITV